MQEGKDFTEAKRVLEDLEHYVKGKIAKKNNVVEETPVAVQEMSLASQPEVVSDHLEEESTLQPLGTETLEVNNKDLESEVPTLESVNGEGTSDLKDAVTLTDNNMISEGVKEVDSNGFVQPEVNAGLIPEVTAQPAGKTDSIINQAGGETLENIPAVSLAPEQGEGKTPDLIDASVGTMATAIGSGNDLSSQQTSGMKTSDAQLQQAQAINSQPIETSQVDGIPEISIAKQESSEGPNNYQASATGAQATVNEIIPAASDNNVVMPTGTTSEEAHDDTLVVGPESFSLSR